MMVHKQGSDGAVLSAPEGPLGSKTTSELTEARRLYQPTLPLVLQGEPRPSDPL